MVMVLVSGWLSGCKPGPATPEQRLREQIARAEAAAEARDHGALREMISERYADAEGHDRRAIEGILRITLMRNQSVHLLSRIRSLDLPQPGRADVLVVVAMAGQPIVSEQDLPALRADLYRFSLEFTEEDGEWRITRAAWQRAAPEDFLL